MWPTGFSELEQRDQSPAIARPQREQPVALDQVVHRLPAANAEELLRPAHVEQRPELPLPQRASRGNQRRPLTEPGGIAQLWFFPREAQLAKRRLE